MPVYTVHAPVATGAGIAATDRFAFVRDGFHFLGRAHRRGCGLSGIGCGWR